MKKSELLDLLKDIDDNSDINKTIQEIEGLAKPFNLNSIKLDDFKNILENNSEAKAYYQSAIDSGIGKGVSKFKENFEKDKLPQLIEEGIKAKSSEGMTEEQKKIKELEDKLTSMEEKEAQNKLIETNRSKLKEVQLSEDLAKYVKTDDDIEFFKNLIANSNASAIKAKLGDSNYEPPTPSVGGITKEQFDKMTYKERVDLYNSDKATYDQLSN